MPHSPIPKSLIVDSFDEMSLHQLQQKLQEMQQFLQQLVAQPELLLPLASSPVLSAPESAGTGSASEHPLQLARQGDAQAQYQLGLAYLKGEQRPLSLCHATCWFQLAALQRHPQAQRALKALQPRLSNTQWQQAQYLAAERLEQQHK